MDTSCKEWQLIGCAITGYVIIQGENHDFSEDY
jgi:hypothetical protein